MTHKPKKILFSVVRNEAPFLLEWIAHNIQLGFDTIVIYSNNCDDGTHEFLDELAAHGVLQHFRHDPVDEAPQGNAVFKFMRSGILSNDDYVMFMDPDEFLNIKIGSRRLDDLIEFTGDYSGMTVSWRLFGDSGNDRFTGRFISSEYTRASRERLSTVLAVKTLVKVSSELERIRVHKPNFSSVFWKQKNTFLASNGSPIDLTKSVYQDWVRKKSGSQIHPDDASYEIAQINHYQYRSRAAFELKNLRGCGGSKMEKSTKYNQIEEPKYNLNGAFDDTILFYKSAVDDEIRRLKTLGTINEMSCSIMEKFRHFESEFLERMHDSKLIQTNDSIADNSSKVDVNNTGKASHLIVHIGQIKTGTTTLQARLSESRQYLEKQSIHYPEGELNSSAHHELSGFLKKGEKQLTFPAFLAKNNGRSLVEASESLVQKVEKRLLEQRINTIVLSSETLVDIATDNSIKNLKELANSLADNVSIVAYVRSPIDGLMSRLQQSLFSATLLRTARWQLQVPELISFKDVFADRFFVREFSRSKLHRGDIIEDFFYHFLPTKTCPSKKYDQLDFNKSLSPEAMFIVQKAKLVLRPDGAPIQNPQFNQLIMRLKQNDLAVEGYSPPRIKPELLLPIMRLQTDALSLRREFGIEFNDLNYDEIGQDSDIDLDRLRIVENICNVDFDRMRLMAEMLSSSKKTSPELVSILKTI